MKKHVKFGLIFVLFFSAVFFRPTVIAEAAGATSAKSMIVMEASSKRILDEKNAFQRLPMASTTKVVTALTVLKNASDIKTVVKIDRRAVGVEGSSIYLQESDELTVEQLLYGLMLQSGNDCAVQLALTVGGSVEKFAEMMNETAKSLGANDSNFVNPHGLHHKDHYTTAYDLGLISCYAMQNESFRTIVGTKQIKMPWADREYPRVVNNKNKTLWQVDGGNGVKTGFTKAAGRCHVAAAEREGMQLVCVVLNCGPMFEDSEALMNRAFDLFALKTIVNPYDMLGTVAVKDSKKEGAEARLTTSEAFLYPLKKDGSEKNKFTVKTEIPEFVKAPVQKNQNIGRIKVYKDNQLIFSAGLYSIDDIERAGFFQRLFD